MNRKLSPIPQIYTLETTILVKKQFPSILPDIQENLSCVQNWSQKCVWRDFEVSLAGYVEMNRKLSSIPQIYTLETTILVEKLFPSLLPDIQENFHCVEISPKNKFSGILKSHSLAMW